VIVSGTTLFALIGPPGAGKTTYCDKVLNGIARISIDQHRSMLSACGGEEDMSVTEQAVHNAFDSLHQHLGQGESVVWDATNARREHRLNLLAVAQQHRVHTVAWVLLPSLGTVLERNARRDAAACPACGYSRRVPEDVVRKMYDEIKGDIPSLIDEGWSHLVIA
jgi:predicted kinase